MKKSVFLILLVLLAVMLVLPSCSGKKSATESAEDSEKESLLTSYPEKSIENVKEALATEDAITLEVIEKSINTTKALQVLEISVANITLENMDEEVKTKFDTIMADNGYTDYVEYLNDIKKVISGYEILLMLNTLESQKGVGGAIVDASAPLVYEMTKSILSQNPASEVDLQVIFSNKEKVESLKELFK